MKLAEVRLKSVKQWTPSFKFLFFPMLLLGLFALSGFIVTSFWKYEWLSAEFFAQGMKYPVVRFWTQLYLVIGNTELLVPLFLLIMVLVESIFKRQIEKKNQFFSKYRWLVLLLYGIVISVWIGINIFKAVEYNWRNQGFGPGIEKWTFGTTKVQQTAKIIVFLFQTSFMVFGSYYVHFKLINKKEFWKEEYWIDAIKALAFFASTYLVVAFLKGMLSRPYYYNLIFGDLLDQLDAQGDGALRTYYLGQSQYQYGYNLDGNWADNIPGIWPWYKANGFFKPLPNMPHLPSPINYAFPSGHVNATYCFASLFFLALGKNRKPNWIIKLLLGLFLLHVLSMTFALLTMRGHWLSDLTFSHVFALLMFPTINLLVNQIMKKIQKKDQKIEKTKVVNKK